MSTARRLCEGQADFAVLSFRDLGRSWLARSLPLPVVGVSLSQQCYRQ